MRDAAEKGAADGPRPRWPQTMRRAEVLSATSRVALAIPSNDSVVNAEAWYPCSLARRAPSSATVLAEDSSCSLRSDPPVERPAVKAPARAKRAAIVSQTVSATASPVVRSGPLRFSWRYVSLGSRHNRTAPVLSFSRQPQLGVLLARASFFRAREVDERSTCGPSVPAGPECWLDRGQAGRCRGA